MPRLFRVLSAAVLLPTHWATPALADHGGPLRDAPMSPLTLALVAGGGVLAVGILIVIIVRVMTGRAKE